MFPWNLKFESLLLLLFSLIWRGGGIVLSLQLPKTLKTLSPPPPFLQVMCMYQSSVVIIVVIKPHW